MFAENVDGRGASLRLPPLNDFASPSLKKFAFTLSFVDVERLRQMSFGASATLQTALAGAIAMESELQWRGAQGDVFRFARGDEYSDHVYVPTSRGLESAWAPWNDR